MFMNIEKGNTKEDNYQLLLETASFYINKDDKLITNLSNLSALINYFLDDINWVGFYLYDGEKLYLGPFQGLPACTEIKLGSGVCGVSAKEQVTYIVKDVNQFAGHIACDSQSASEIVLPLVKDGALIGVLDIDSPSFERFDEVDKVYLEKVINKLIDIL